MSAYSVLRIRRSLTYFILGKGLGFIFGVCLLLVLVRVLDVEAYKFYLFSQAFLIIVNQLSSLGFEQTVQRYLPELLTRSEGRTLRKLTIKLCVWRFASFVFIAISLYFLADEFIALLNLDGMATELRMFLFVVVFELSARFIDIIFESFLLQGAAQISLVLRVGLRLMLVVWLALPDMMGAITLRTWILIDIAASALGCTWGAIMLIAYIRRIAKELPGVDSLIEYTRYRKYSLPIYVAGTITLLSGQDVIKLIAINVLSNTQFAAFGFAANFVYMINRYLPTTLFLGMIRPLFVTARQRSDYKTRLPMIAELSFKLNIFTLLPIIAFIVVMKDEVINLLTGGRYPEAANYIIAFLPILISQPLRSVISLTALAMENARAPLIGTVLSLFGLVIGVALSYLIGAYGYCIGLFTSNLLFSIWVVKELRVYKFNVETDWSSYTKMIFSTSAVACAMMILNNETEITSLVMLVTCAFITVVFYLTITYIYKPFKQNERDVLNMILKRKVFVW